MTKITLIENMSEIAAGTRGSSLGLGALKVAARNKNSTYFSRFETITIENENHLLDTQTEKSYANHIDGVVSIFTKVSKLVSDQLSLDRYPIIIAGDHASAGGTIAGIIKNNLSKKLGVIWIDAHADLHTPFTTPSGNLHGMTLATALGIDNIENKKNNPNKRSIEKWEAIKNIGSVKPKIETENLVFIGVRDTEPPEDNIIQTNNIRSITVEELRKTGIAKIIADVENYLAACDMIYVSFDVDAMDCDLVSCGTGTPVKNGITAKEAKALVTAFAGMEKTICLEFVEINPCLDNKKNTMAEITFDILNSATAAIEKKTKNEH